MTASSGRTRSSVTAGKLRSHLPVGAEGPGEEAEMGGRLYAVRMDGVSVNDHAADIGVSDASIVYKWLARAEKKLKEN